MTRLEKDGTVRREGCPTDKRGHMAVLTDEGMALLERAAPGHVETVRTAIFDHLTPEQVGQLDEICRNHHPGDPGREFRGARGGSALAAAFLLLVRRPGAREPPLLEV